MAEQEEKNRREMEGEYWSVQMRQEKEEGHYSESKHQCFISLKAFVLTNQISLVGK